MARQARDGGAAGLLVYPPTALRGLTDLDNRVVEVHKAVAEQGLPVIAFYLYEAAGGIPYSTDTVNELLDLQAVIGVKIATLDSVMTFQDLAAEVRYHPQALLITGEDRFLGYSLALGADAALVGMAAALTDVSCRLLAAWFERDLDAFTELSVALDGFSRSTFHQPMDGYVQRMLWALEADGVLQSNPRDPFGPGIPVVEQTAVAAAVAHLRNR
jgi:4-hydroxy-tetrahydrodipicolinate synthase